MTLAGEPPRREKNEPIISKDEMKELSAYFTPSEELLSDNEKQWRRYVEKITKAESGIWNLDRARERIETDKLQNISFDEIQTYGDAYNSWINSWHTKGELKHSDWARGNKDMIVGTLRRLDPSLKDVNATHFEDFIEAYSAGYEKRYRTALVGTLSAWIEHQIQILSSLELNPTEQKKAVTQSSFFSAFHWACMVLDVNRDYLSTELRKKGGETILKTRDFLRKIVQDEQGAITQSWMPKTS